MISYADNDWMLENLIRGRSLMMFLDADRPLPGCMAENCDGCEMPEKLVCHYDIRQLMGFLVMAAPVFLLGGYFR